MCIPNAGVVKKRKKKKKTFIYTYDMPKGLVIVGTEK